LLAGEGREPPGSVTRLLRVPECSFLTHIFSQHALLPCTCSALVPQVQSCA
jgi:hypothetical protein